MPTEYKNTPTNGVVQRASDGAFIPDDPDNRDRVAYTAWLDGGGTPDPYEPPPQSEPELSADDVVLLSLENRLRSLEGNKTMVVDMESLRAEAMAAVEAEPPQRILR